MSFLHSLIHSKLASAIKTKKQQPLVDELEDEEATLLPDLSTTAGKKDASSTDSGLEELPDKATVLSSENLVFVNPTPADLALHKLEKVSRCSVRPVKSLLTFVDPIYRFPR